MQLLNRYLHAVKGWLPEKQQDEFLVELEDDLRSQIEDQEQHLGRKLSEPELASLLKAKGHPMLVATRFMPQQQLIGPAWFPIWRFAIRAIVLWIMIPVFVLVLAPLAAISSSDPVGAFLGVLFKLPFQLLVTAGMITGVVALLERLNLKVNPFASWDPSHLPPAPEKPGTHLSRCESAFEMAADTFLLLWWTGLVQISPHHSIQITLGPVWATLFWPVTILLAAGLSFAMVKLLRPEWRPAYGFTTILQHAAMMLIAWLLASSTNIVTVAVVGAASAKTQKLTSIIEWSVAMSLFGVIAVGAVTIFLEIRRLLASHKIPVGIKLNPSLF